MSGYTSVLKSSSYLYLELKKACNLKIQSLDENEIRNKAIEENIFALSTETRKKGIASAVVNRLKVLDDYLIDKIANGNLQTSKQLALYSILKTDRLF